MALQFFMLDQINPSLCYIELVVPILIAIVIHSQLWLIHGLGLRGFPIVWVCENGAFCERYPFLQEKRYARTNCPGGKTTGVG